MLDILLKGPSRVGCTEIPMRNPFLREVSAAYLVYLLTFSWQAISIKVVYGRSFDDASLLLLACRKSRAAVD